MVNQQELNRLNIARGDIGDAVRFLDAAAGREPTSVEYEALVMMAIVLYARPFSTNELSAAAMASRCVPDSVIDGYSEAEKTLHSRIIEVRNKAVAHSEWTNYPTSVSWDIRVIKSRRYSIYPEFLTVAAFVDLAKKLHQRLHNMVADRVRQEP